MGKTKPSGFFVVCLAVQYPRTTREKRMARTPTKRQFSWRCRCRSKPEPVHSLAAAFVKGAGAPQKKLTPGSKKPAGRQRGDVRKHKSELNTTLSRLNSCATWLESDDCHALYRYRYANTIYEPSHQPTGGVWQTRSIPPHPILACRYRFREHVLNKEIGNFF
jgi:hypothetical protein